METKIFKVTTYGPSGIDSTWVNTLDSTRLAEPKQKERALNLLEKTKKNCMIINSVKTEVLFSFSII